MSDWFAERVLTWAEQHGRKDLPWQQERTPYRVWVAEIMLQQTQVQTVIPYFDRFMSSLPNVSSLAKATIDEVLSLWTGLGYYRRARLLHKAAIQIVKEHDGRVPNSIEALINLPGIGRSTAGAILSSGFNQPGVILDGNVKRVLTRFHAVEGELRRAAVQNQLWTLAETHTPAARNDEYAQAIMDLGATCCTKKVPNCSHCPVHTQCVAFSTNEVDQFPNTGKRKSARDETLHLLLIIDAEGRSLLQQQPMDGLWGGLWLPIRVDGLSRPTGLLARLGIWDGNIRHEATLATFTHTLSHIRFKVQTRAIYLSTIPDSIPSRHDLVWFDTGSSQTMGLSRLTLALLEKAENEREIS